MHANLALFVASYTIKQV